MSKSISYQIKSQAESFFFSGFSIYNGMTKFFTYMAEAKSQVTQMTGLFFIFFCPYNGMEKEIKEVEVIINYKKPGSKMYLESG